MKLPQEASVHYPILLFVVMLGLAAQVQAAILIGMGRNSVWFVFVCLLLVLFGVWMSLKARNNDGYSLIHAAEQLGFSLFGRLVYVLYAVLFLGLSGYIYYFKGDFFSRVFLSGSPRAYIMLEAIIAILIALYPIETHARYAHVISIFVVPFFLLITLSPLLAINWTWVAPIFNVREIVDPWSSLALVMLSFAPLAAVGLIDKSKAEFNGLSILLLTTVVAVFISFLLAEGIALFGLTRAQQNVYLGYSIINSVQLENFVLERIVYLWVIYWKFITLVGAGFTLRCGARAIAGVLGVRINWIYIVASGLVSGGSLLFVQSPFAILQFEKILGYYAMFMLIVFPLILYLLMRLKGAFT